MTDSLFFVKENELHQAIKTKLQAATRNVTSFPLWAFGFKYAKVTLVKDKPIGLLLKKDTVISVRQNGQFYGILRSGDVITHIDGKLMPNDHDKIFKVFLSKLPATFNIAFARLKNVYKGNIDGEKLVQQLRQAGYKYDYKFLYFVRGMSLGVDIRDIEIEQGKPKMVYVTAIQPDSIASMSLAKGDRILEIGMTRINSAKQAMDLIKDYLKTSGFLRILVEIPHEENYKNFIRILIGNYVASLLTQPKNLVVQPELRSIAYLGVQAILKARKNNEEPKSILRKKPSMITEKKRCKDTNSKDSKSSKVEFNKKVKEYGTPMEATCRWLIKIPKKI